MRNNVYLVRPSSACIQQCTMRLTGAAFGGDGPKFDTDRMMTLFKVRERVAVPAQATMVPPPTAARAAGAAEREVLLELTFRAMRQPFAHQVLPTKQISV